MYHLPKGKTWDARLLADALQKRGVSAAIEGDRVTMTLPVERIDIEKVLDKKVRDELKPEIVGQASATIAFAPGAVLENIVFECTRTLEPDCFAATTAVAAAVLACGYESGSERDLANKYYRGELDIDAIFDRIEQLQVDKEQAVAEYRFDDALAILEKQRPLRQNIEDLLRDSIGDGMQ